MRGSIRTLLGLLTIAAMIAGGWFIYDLATEGSYDGDEVLLVLRFNDAHGVPVGGNVRHKGVTVGEVLSVGVAPDDSGVVMELAVAGAFAHTLRESSRFWIVHPRFGGLAEGATGLDTLIKDPYVEYDTLDLSSPTLASGSLLFGQNQPPVSTRESASGRGGRRLAPLLFKVRFGLARGLREGAPVLYRDVEVGTVLGVDLSIDGRSVEAEVKVHGRYANTVRTTSIFWVARPNVEVGFNWPSLVNVTDLSKIITGTALAYATPSDPPGGPLASGSLLVGRDEPLDDAADYAGPLIAVEPLGGEDWPQGFAAGVEPVGVSIAFTEKDFFRSKRYFFEGTGILFRGSRGKVLVLTAKTLADGAFSSSDTIGSADIEDTNLKVRFADGTATSARRVWVDPNDRDLAILEIPEGALPRGVLDSGAGAPVFSPDSDTREYFILLAFRKGDGLRFRSQPIPRDKLLEKGRAVRAFDSDLDLKLTEWLGAVLADREGRIVGIVGRRKTLSEDLALSVLSAPPTLLRRATADASGESDTSGEAKE